MLFSVHAVFALISVAFIASVLELIRFRTRRYAMGVLALIFLSVLAARGLIALHLMSAIIFMAGWLVAFGCGSLLTKKRLNR